MLYKVVIVASSKKFAIYLYQNHHLGEDFAIPKTDCRYIFQTFRKTFNVTNTSFSTMLFHSLPLLSKQKNHELIKYRQCKLMKLLQKNVDSNLSGESINQICWGVLYVSMLLKFKYRIAFFI